MKAPLDSSSSQPGAASARPDPPRRETPRTALVGIAAEDARRELEEFTDAAGQPRYRARQVFSWLWQKTPRSFAEMSDLPSALRERLEAHFVLHPLQCGTELESSDGTRKYLWQRAAGGEIESVVIPDGARNTYCISTQAGCPVGCTFCATGYGGFEGQLAAAEIVDQILQMRLRNGSPPTNLVFMGMGEPLLNLPEVLQALRILTNEEQLGLGARRITVSTVGVPARILELGHAFPQVKLALSLHAPEEELRSEIIPLNRQFPLRDVLRAVRAHGELTGRRATFEYVVLPGVNDSREQAREICRRVAEIPSRINLIGFNPFPGAPYQKPPVSLLERFRAWLLEDYRGPVTIRRSRGEDIRGACGQLSLMNRGGHPSGTTRSEG